MEVLISTLKEMVSFIKDWGALIIAGISLLVAIISLSKSSKAQRLQNKVNELELKIKQDELDKITKEKEDAELACVEARFITVGKGKHRLKVWNSGNATAYHVSARFDGDVGIMPYSLKKLKGFFEVYNIHAALSDAVQLIYKSEFESAAREAFVAVENYLKKKSGLDSHGFDLATRALSFEIDKQTGEKKRAPLIAINDLKNESERNEQDGIRYMLMGFFQGPRNLYQHNHIGSGVSNSISVIIEASFFLHLLDGHSITQNGRWIPETVDYREIYQKMPKRIHRWKLMRLLKKRDRRLKKNP